MAHATHSTLGQHTSSGLWAAIRSVFARIADNQRRDRIYRKTHHELDQMTDRDLADIGITRFMIRDVAAEASARA